MRAPDLTVRLVDTISAHHQSEVPESVRTGSVHRLHSVTIVRHTLYFLVTAGLAACAADPAEDLPMLDCPTEGRYMELRPGMSWTYQVDDGDLEEKTQTVGPLEDVGGDKTGTMAYRLETIKDSGVVVSWQEDTGDAVLRHREMDMAGEGATDEVYQPHKLRVSEVASRLQAGVSWTETYTEIVTDMDTLDTTTTEKTESWEVEAVDEVVRVPAGDFCALRVHRTSSIAGSDGSDKTYWFARGVGKIKETGGNQVEELTQYIGE